MVLVLIFLLGWLGSTAVRMINVEKVFGYRPLPLLSVITFFLALISLISWGKWGIPDHHQVLSWTLLGEKVSFSTESNSLIFCFLVVIVGLFVSIFTLSYFSDSESDKKFHPVFLLFTLGMVGLIVSDHAILLFTFWELTSVASYYLISFYNQRTSAVKAATQALIVTGFGGLLMLVGFILIYQITGTFLLSGWLGRASFIVSSTEGILALIFIAIGALTKSAQFPFHSWLPAAMTAPTPASAFLHSATMVKAGVILLFRLSPLIILVPWFPTVLSIIGSLTIFVACIRVFSTSDLKLILAYSTLAILGLLNISIWLSPGGAEIFIFLLVAHGLYKSSLFLSVGSLDHQSGSKDVFELFGLKKLLPKTFFAFFLGLVCMIGLPGTIGGLAKEFLFKLSPNPYPALVAVSITSGVLLASVFRIFFENAPIRKSEPRSIKEASLFLWMPPTALAVLSFVAVFFVKWLGLDIQKINFEPEKSTYFGWWATLGIVLIAIFGFHFHKTAQLRFLPIGSQIFDRVLNFLTVKLPEVVYKYLQPEEVGTHIKVIILIWILALGISLASILPFLASFNFNAQLALESHWQEGIIFLTMAIGAFFVVRADVLLKGVLSLSLVGLGVVFVFARGSAPDLALTQVGVEALSLVIFILFLKYIPTKFWKTDQIQSRQLDGIFAVLFGTTLGLLSFFQQQHVPTKISQFFNENSLSLGHGANVVNVILVDFRALDTLGEVTVLTIAILSALSALNILKVKKLSSGFSMPVLNIFGPLLMVLILFFAGYYFIRGHNAPGGGFIAGLIFSFVILLGILTLENSKFKNIFYFKLAMNLGLFVIFVSGMIGLLRGKAFLTGVWVNIGSGIHVGTPMLFDLGVMLVVAGLFGCVAMTLIGRKV